MTIAASWKTIEKWLSTNVPEVKKTLRKPANKELVAKVEKKLKVTLPADFVASALIHDGQNFDTGEGIFFDPTGDEFEASYLMIPLADIPNGWKIMNDLQDMGDFDGREREAVRGVEPLWWNRGWIPIADNEGGDFFCLDLAPAKGGRVGQVILFSHEGEPIRRVAWSFEEWMEKLAKRYKAGKIKFDSDDEEDDDDDD